MNDETVTEPVDETASEEDWRATIDDPDLQRLAQRYESPTALTRAVAALRRETATRIKPLGDSPTDEEIASYRRQTGVPDTADGYAFASPDGFEPNESNLAFRSAMAEAMHGAHVSALQAAALHDAFNAYVARQQAEAETAATEALERNVTALRQEFGADYDRNIEQARRAARAFGNAGFIDFLESRTVDGVPLGDHPEFVRAFARIGRGAEEAPIDADSGAADASTLDERIRDKRREIQDALDRGDHRRAHELDREERALWGRVGG